MVIRPSAFSNRRFPRSSKASDRPSHLTNKIGPPSKSSFPQRYGPWAVIAGASEGLGAEFAAQLAGKGLNLVLVARRINLLEALATRLKHEFSVEVRCLILDLSDPRASAEIDQFSASLDCGLLVYNAAFSNVGPFLKNDPADQLREIETNVATPMRLAQTFGDRLTRRGRGGLILMSSLSALQGSAYVANYAATKAYLLTLAEGLAEEWRSQGVDVLACAAGIIRTPTFLASQPRQTGGLSDAAADPAGVAREALAGLGKQTLLIPGLTNRLASFVLHRLLPRRSAVRIMADILRKKYGP